MWLRRAVAGSGLFVWGLALQTILLGTAPANAATGPLSAIGAPGKPLRGYKICVDPGHGGQHSRQTRYTGGTHGVATRQTESDVNLRVSLMLAQFLEEAGATVFLTRTTDNRVQDKPDMASELDARSRYANSRGADLFISMHHNHGPRGTNYTAVFYHRNSPVSGRLADQISASLAFCMGTPNIGARSSAYRVLKDLKMPGVIVECSFMTNHSEDVRLANLSYNKLQAKGVAVGIINYVRQTKGRGVDFTTVFGPLDTLGNRTQVVADSTYRGDGPPPSAPFFGRRNSTPADDAAFAAATAPPGLEPGTESEIAAAAESLGASGEGGPEPGLAPLPQGAPTRLEALRQSAAQQPVRGASGATTSRASNSSRTPPSGNAARTGATASHARSATNSRTGSPATSARSSTPANSSRSAPGVVARSPGAAASPSRTSNARPAAASRPAGNSSNSSSNAGQSRSATTSRPSSGSTTNASGRSGSSSGRSSSSSTANKPAPGASGTQNQSRRPAAAPAGSASVSYSRRSS